ncbi:MAG TPA: polyprenyl diphosphate synthase [Candidatus Nanoarchaeia archaeon]|nr:polyprenyl diphosphate synthase [Candidatus Nanoarchaeia archaeon]
MQPTMSDVPKSIGVILDGNRRFAKRLMLKPWKGHEFGAKKVEELFEWCKELGIKEVTLYCFSVQNFSRPKEEFDYLMDLFRKEYRKYSDDKRRDELKRDGVRINFIGRLEMFPDDLQSIMKKLMEETKDGKNYSINFAMGYGGREEVIDAIRKLAKQVKEGKIDVDKINDEVFADNLYTKAEPELIIRTGGEKRTSNFLLWQSHYSEWIFLEKAWPEFQKEDFINCLEEFSQRKRRFGR